MTLCHILLVWRCWINIYFQTGFIHKNTHTHTHIYIYMCVCVCVCIYIYIYMEWGIMFFTVSFISKLHITMTLCPVSWGCRIHRLHLCGEVRPHPRWVPWIWHWTIWWWGSSDAGALGNAEYLFIAIAPRSTLAWCGSTW